MHYLAMTTHADIVKQAGKAPELADKLGVSVHTVRSWIARNTIPPAHWYDFEQLGFSKVSKIAEAERGKEAA